MPHTVAFCPHCPFLARHIKCARVCERTVNIRDKGRMNTKHRNKLKTTLLAGVALATASLTAQAATEVAPYFYTWAFGGSGYAANSLAQAKAAGVEAVTLAFGTSNGSCTLQGFNFSSSTKTDVQNYIAGGGRIILSFGGADGPFLEDSCSASGFYNIVNNLVSTYKIYNLDFDVEGSEVDDTTAANTRNAAIKQLQAAYPNLYVSFTVPVGSGGLPGDVLTLIKNAKNAGVKINVVNIMTMDYGSDTGGKAEGAVAVESANATFNQLKSVYTNETTAQIWAMIGITPMIGLNDGSTTKNPSEQFTPTDANTVTQFAETNGIGLLSYWALNRDQPGTVNNENDLDTFDGTGTTKFGYYNTFKAAMTDGGGTTPPPVVNGAFPAGTYTIVNVFSGKCVDVNAASTAPQAVVQQYDCNGTGAQSFQVIDEGNGWYKILNTNSHLAVDVIGASTANGTHIQQYTDNGTGAQRYAINVSDSSDPTAMEIVNETSGKCIDDTNWGTTDRNPLQQWSCTGGTNQSFRFYPIGSPTAVSVK
jgi:chitinase